MNFRKQFLYTLLLIVSMFSAAVSLDDIQTSVKLSQKSYLQQDTVIAALIANIPSKYHLYGNPLGPGIGKPLSISATGDGIRWLSILKQKPEKFTPETGGWVWAYKNSAVFFMKGVFDDNVISGLRINATAGIDALICHRSCIPVHKDMPFTIEVNKESAKENVLFDDEELDKLYRSVTDTMTFAPVISSLTSELTSGPDLFSQISTGIVPQKTSSDDVNWAYTPVEKKVKFNLFLAICFGFIAGIILNFMPCVLPVLGIKILSFSETSSGTKKSALFRSAVFSAGILSVFTILAALASFASFSWGEQFQNPFMLIGIITLIVVFALWMFEIFIFNIPGNFASGGSKQEGLLGDFFKGVFATILATPCSGPFLGATLAWAMTQPHAVVFTVFLAIGAGMAFPYILLSSSKRLSGFIPKPGKWMVDFKNIMGFILIGFAVYLLAGLPQDMIVSAIGICVVVVFAIAIYNRIAPWGISTLKMRMLGAVIAIAVASAGVYSSYSVLYRQMSSQIANESADESIWNEFSTVKLNDAHRNAQNVIVDFTANWCINCQYNKITVYHSKEVMSLIEKKNIIALKADLTKPDTVISSLMQKLGSRSVPFFAIFPGNDPTHPVVMRDIVQKGDVVRALKALPDKN